MLPGMFEYRIVTSGPVLRMVAATWAPGGFLHLDQRAGGCRSSRAGSPRNSANALTVSILTRIEFG